MARPKKVQVIQDESYPDPGKIPQVNDNIQSQEQSVMQPQPVKPIEGGKIATKDINLTYRKGDFVPDETLLRWKMCGLDMDVYFK